MKLEVSIHVPPNEQFSAPKYIGLHQFDLSGAEDISKVQKQALEAVKGSSASVDTYTLLKAFGKYA